MDAVELAGPLGTLLGSAQWKKKKKKHKSPEGSGSQEGRMVGVWTGNAKNGQAFEEP